jgi:PEP-CTERM motif
LKQYLFALTLSAVCIPAMSAVVLVNETFESINSSLQPSPGNYVTLSGGSSFAGSNGTTWTIGGDSIDFINAAFGSPTGSVGIDLNGDAAGSISTTVNVASGLSSFRLSFAYWGNGGAGKTLNWGVGTLGSSLISSASAQAVAISWIADETSPVDLFFSGGVSDGFAGFTIDDITLTQEVISAVPEPGEWAMMLAGLGVVGAIARRRKA